MGMAFTTEADFYGDRLAGHGLAVLVPPAEDRAEVHRIIQEELCLGVVRDEPQQTYREVISRLVGAGAQGIVLGCTEIELLVTPADSAAPVFPTTRAARRGSDRSQSRRVRTKLTIPVVVPVRHRAWPAPADGRRWLAASNPEARPPPRSPTRY
ncbi:MAG: aspartate/glutamate racemase family protein [Janthinobacterium lividum]